MNGTIHSLLDDECSLRPQTPRPRVQAVADATRKPTDPADEYVGERANGSRSFSCLEAGKKGIRMSELSSSIEKHRARRALFDRPIPRETAETLLRRSSMYGSAPRST